MVGMGLGNIVVAGNRSVMRCVRNVEYFGYYS